MSPFSIADVPLPIRGVDSICPSALSDWWPFSVAEKSAVRFRHPTKASFPRTSRWKRRSKGYNPTAFTLLELLVAMAVLAMMAVMMLSITSSAQKVAKQTTSRTEQFREGRRAFDRINQRLSQASLNTYWDSQVSGYKCHNSNWLESNGSKCLKSFSVSSSCIGVFSNG